MNRLSILFLILFCTGKYRRDPTVQIVHGLVNRATLIKIRGKYLLYVNLMNERYACIQVPSGGIKMDEQS